MNIEKLSEDEVRTKIVNDWLKDCGLAADQIRIEYSINLRLGKGIRPVNSRTDLLVQNLAGDNLLIIELKKPTHKLRDADRQQAISYARSLAEGGIAPFTILTNSKEVQIYDSITGDEIGTSVPGNHPVIKNNFKVSGDVLLARSEALAYLITLSKDNLMAFCKGQVDHRMTLLKSDNPWSEKKYIPQLYVNRANAEHEIKTKLFHPEFDKDIVLVVGPPQHGKTCLMCHTADQYLLQNIPVLFYPAIGLDKGLLTAIQDDFCWTFGERLTPIEIVSRLARITANIESPLLIIVDGWNEMGDHAIRINNEIQRLDNKNIKVLLSTTSPSLGQLLIDDADNLSYVAVTTRLKNSLIKRISSEPLQNVEELDVVQIGNFTFNEMELAKKLYGEIFNVTFANSDLPYDPFYLRIASEQYTNCSVPNFSTLTDLIGNSLVRKARRRAIKEIELFYLLKQLAKIMLKYDTPFLSTLLVGQLSSQDKFCAWAESGILQMINTEPIPHIDFYLTHHKSYAIAIVHRRWQDTLLSGEESQINTEMNLALKTVAGQTALLWFLSVPEHATAFKAIFKTGSYFDNISPKHLKVFSDAIANQINFNQNLSFDWLDPYIEKLCASSQDQSTNIEQVTILIYSLVKSLDRSLQKDKYEMWMRILLKTDNSIDEIGIEESYVHKIYGEDIRSVDGYDFFVDGDFDLPLFEKFIYDGDIVVATRALTFMAYASPYYTQEILINVINHHKGILAQEAVEDLINESCKIIINNLSTHYWGDMCRGWFTDAEPGDQEVLEEFKKQKAAWSPILNFLRYNMALYATITSELKNLAEYVITSADAEIVDENGHDPNQLTFDL
ncbi:type I restriction enzyme HsdR N-terminal domain-containing protein [Pedobacter deserti]|uniref:type I restriction enzyme HsdR N-terminal domain-containing protein n=1 Tax=Pedobacter deserti TaxID=2817382 RepID=UPI00210A4DD7|nr:type I restriction enzyme HsdR N-terminal domain-containing protein [Pedobacter sp. SYSU D00382]